MSRFNNFPNPDLRSNLGYGVNSKRHQPRTAQTSFPYFDDDKFSDDEEQEYDDVFISKLMKKLGFANSSDALAYKSSDAGSYKDLMGKMSKIGESVSSHMSPIPNLYKNKSAVSGGTTPSATRGMIGYSNKTEPTGSFKGWSKSLPHSNKIEKDENLEKIRLLIRMIHQLQEEK